ncbi:MAG TPA: AMP-binding protein [Burkholderiaceae bacterium]|nr:AMP-binding protein [Burkholderiaceae bacterium]
MSAASAARSAQTDRFVHERLPAPADWPYLHYDLPPLRIAAQVNLVAELLDGALAKGWGERPMLRSPTRVLSYRQALERVQAIGQVLTGDLRLEPGNRVLLRGGNSIDMALAWLAVVRAGLVAVATMPLLRAAELSAVIAKAQPALALCDARLLDDLQSAVAQTPLADGQALRVIAFDAENTQPPPPGSLNARADERQGQALAPCPVSADDIALMAFTSGTTGKPKAVIHRHREVLAACQAWPREFVRATPDDVVIGSPPLAFTFGLGGMLLFPMAAGASVLYADGPYTPERLARCIHDFGVTICYTAPTFYRQTAPHMKALEAERGKPRLRLAVSAGEGLPPATRALWHEATGLHLMDGIGATEMFHIFISSDGGPVPPGALGRVVPGYVARVVGEDGQELPRGQIGRLAVTGPTGCRYLDDDRQRLYVKDGWNYPGDAFLQDEAGYFHYRSRTDDMIVTAGYNVGGPEVEDALLQHPAVAECGVVGESDEERGMIIAAYCVLRPGQVGDAAMVKALQDHVKARLAPYKYPRKVVFVAQLPRTETGKLQRFKLKASS